MSATELPQPTTPSRRDHVLVIDDDPLFRSLLVTILRRDFGVSVASEGSEGFYQALERIPTLAVIDIQMPGWDGLRTLQAFRSHPLLQALPIIIMTSDASRETVMAAIHGGADEYIVKTSFNRDSLLEKVRCLLARGERKSVAVSAATAADRSQLPTGLRSSGEDAVDALLAEESRLQEVLDGWE